ncbi:restriction endonuclease subunit S [Aphanizomenon sp. PH219]|nr:restriction endonuclease subunit S [Aphanizomenon sp. 202]MDK2459441.1 restriction endonuclease subunit S [Aphanizomenon sp. PH219]
MTKLWLQNLPEKWKTVRLKTVVELKTLRANGSSTKENYIGLENIEPWTGRLLKSAMSENTSNDEDEKESVVSRFKPGNILFGKLRPYLAKVHLAQEYGICTTELLVLNPSEVLFGRFVIYVLLTPEFINLVNAETFGARMPRADWNTIGDLLIPLPSLAEQIAIANYLDHETAKIDKLISAKERLLELLSEKRQALIFHSVTRGINPKSPMRHSGLEWIGEIPAHWEVVKVKYVAKVGNGSTPLRDNKAYWENGTFPWLTSTVVNDDVIGEPTEFVTEIALQECHLPIVQSGSVLVAITGEGKTRGKAALLSYPATINQHLTFIFPQPNLLIPEFLQLFLSSSYEILRMISEGTGSTKGALTCEQLSEFVLPLPPLIEQQQIITILTQNKVNLDTLTRVSSETIKLLQERRAVLITDAVSGKMKLPDVP